jgi:hypothetical protein
VRRAVSYAAVALALAVLTVAQTGCVAAQQRALYRESRALAQAIKKQDTQAVSRRVLPGARATVDTRRLLADEPSKAWSAALDRPTSVRPEATLFLAPEDPVAVVWTDEGWRFASDPADFYAQGTPREALRSLVRASANARWDRLIELAPRRYRMGLSAEDLRHAWTESEQAAALREARDRLAAHLGDPIRADSHEAVLDLGGGRAARLEREGTRWVVVDF